MRAAVPETEAVPGELDLPDAVAAASLDARRDSAELDIKSRSSISGIVVSAVVTQRTLTLTHTITPTLAPTLTPTLALTLTLNSSPNPHQVAAVVSQEILGVGHALTPAAWPARLRLASLPLYVGLGTVSGITALVFKAPQP